MTTHLHLLSRFRMNGTVPPVLSVTFITCGIINSLPPTKLICQGVLVKFLTNGHDRSQVRAVRRTVTIVRPRKEVKHIDHPNSLPASCQASAARLLSVPVFVEFALPSSCCGKYLRGVGCLHVREITVI